MRRHFIIVLKKIESREGNKSTTTQWRNGDVSMQTQLFFLNLPVTLVNHMPEMLPSFAVFEGFATNSWVLSFDLLARSAGKARYNGLVAKSSLPPSPLTLSQQPCLDGPSPAPLVTTITVRKSDWK